MPKILLILFVILLSIFAIFYLIEPASSQDWADMPTPSIEPEGITPLNELSLPPMAKIHVKVVLDQHLGQLVVQDKTGMIIELIYHEPISLDDRLQPNDLVEFVGYYNGKKFIAKYFQRIED